MKLCQITAYAYGNQVFIKFLTNQLYLPDNYFVSLIGNLNKNVYIPNNPPAPLITKAASTTLSIMALDEDGHLDQSDRLGAFFPEYKRSGLKYLRVRHLLAHHTGLQANLPISDWYKEPEVFSPSKTVDYSVALASNYFIKGNIERILAKLLIMFSTNSQKRI